MRTLIIILVLCFAATAYAQIAVPLGSNPNVNQTVPVFPNVSFGLSMTGSGVAPVGGDALLVDNTNPALLVDNTNPACLVGGC